MTTVAGKSRRGPQRTTVLLVGGMVVALLVGTAGGAVGASFVTSAQIKNGTIRNVDVHKNTLTGKKIKNGSLKSADVKDGSLTGADVKDGSLTGGDIKDGSLTAKDVALGTLTGAQVAAGSLTGAQVAAGSLDGGHVADASLTSADLAPELRPRWAVVESDGTLARSTAGVTTDHYSLGVTYVDFGEDVSACALLVSLGNSTSGVPGPAIVSATPAAGNASSVYVASTKADGTPMATGFHLAVLC